ncbi:MAG: LbetaH domain-containing protein [Planctomycetota bacterium]
MSGPRSLAWAIIGRPLVRWSPHAAYGLRRAVLRAFGARVAGSVKIRRSVHIDRPWNLELGDLAIVGDGACLLAREPLSIGARAVVSQLVVLATEALGRREGPERAAVRIEDDAWVAADALVLPGSVVGRGAVVGARAVVDGEIPAWRVAVGRPAAARGTRSFAAAGGGDAA